MVFEALSIQMYKGICTELGCICNELFRWILSLGKVVMETRTTRVHNESWDTLGFSNYSTEFNWTVSNELEALTILLLMCAFCVGITYNCEDTRKFGDSMLYYLWLLMMVAFAEDTNVVVWHVEPDPDGNGVAVLVSVEDYSVDPYPTYVKESNARIHSRFVYQHLHDQQRIFATTIKDYNEERHLFWLMAGNYKHGLGSVAVKSTWIAKS